MSIEELHQSIMDKSPASVEPDKSIGRARLMALHDHVQKESRTKEKWIQF